MIRFPSRSTAARDRGHGGALLGREAGGERIQGGADLVAVAHHAEVDRRHDEPAPTGVLEQAVALEQEQRLLHGLPGDAEACRQLLLHEVRARRERPSQISSRTAS